MESHTLMVDIYIGKLMICTKAKYLPPLTCNNSALKSLSKEMGVCVHQNVRTKMLMVLSLKQGTSITLSKAQRRWRRGRKNV